LTFVGGLLGVLVGSIGRIKSLNQIKQMYDKVSILFLVLFVILLSFLMVNLSLRIITDSSLILILFFIDFAFGALFSARYADRKSQLKKEHPS
jgi:Ca2+/Na+ antiporter